MQVFQRLVTAREREESTATLAKFSAISAALGTPKDVLQAMETVCTRSWEQVEELDLQDLEGVSDTRHTIRETIRAHENKLWDALSAATLADTNLLSRRVFRAATEKVRVARKLCKTEDDRLCVAICFKEVFAAVQGNKASGFMCDSMGGHEELRAPFTLLQSLKQAAVQFHQQNEADKLTQAATVAQMHLLARQQAESAQAEVQEAEARATAAAQNAEEAKAALTSLQATLVAAQHRSWVFQAAQTDFTFNLKRQLAESQAEGSTAKLQHDDIETELRVQLQSATVRADAAELGKEKMAVQLVALQKAHDRKLRRLHGQQEARVSQLITDLHKTAASVTAAEQKSHKAMAELAAQHDAHCMELRQLQGTHASIISQLRHSLQEQQGVMAAQMAAQQAKLAAQSGLTFSLKRRLVESEDTVRRLEADFAEAELYSDAEALQIMQALLNSGANQLTKQVSAEVAAGDHGDIGIKHTVGGEVRTEDESRAQTACKPTAIQGTNLQPCGSETPRQLRQHHPWCEDRLQQQGAEAECVYKDEANKHVAVKCDADTKHRSDVGIRQESIAGIQQTKSASQAASDEEAGEQAEQAHKEAAVQKKKMVDEAKGVTFDRPATPPSGLSRMSSRTVAAASKYQAMASSHQVEEENMSDGAREQLQQAAAIVTAAEQDTEKAQSAAHQESHSKGLRHLQDGLGLGQEFRAQNAEAQSEPKGVLRHAQAESSTRNPGKAPGVPGVRLQPSGSGTPRQHTQDHLHPDNRSSRDTAGGHRSLMSAMDSSGRQSGVQAHQHHQSMLSPARTQGARPASQLFVPKALRSLPAASQYQAVASSHQAAAQAAVQGSTRSQVPAAHPQGQGVEADAWAFVGVDGRSWGVVSKAMMVAFWKKRKLLAQTLVYHASEGVEQGRALNKFYKQWKEKRELPSGLAIQGLDAETAWAQLRVIRSVRQQGDPV